MRPPVEALVSFLLGHAVPAQSPLRGGGVLAIDTTCGCVALREPLRFGARYPSTRELSVAFDDVFRDARARVLPAPDATALLAFAQAMIGASDTWRADVGMALGEACARDDGAFAKLRSRAEAAPADPMLVLAMGWSDRPESVLFLKARLEEAAATDDDRDGTVRLDAMRAAATGLHHADEGAFWKVVGSLRPGRSDRVVEQLGSAALVHWRLGLLDSAADADARRVALMRLCSFDLGRAPSAPPPGQDAIRFFRELLAASDSDDRTLGAAARASADAYLYPFGHSPIRARVSDNASAQSWNGEAVGSSADEHALLAMLVADLEAGRMAFRDSEPGLFERASQWIDTCGPARSGFATAGGGELRAPVHVSAEWTDAGLRLRLRNAGDAAFAVDPVGLRYGHAESVTMTTTEHGQGRTTIQVTRLALGVIGGHASVQFRHLVVLRPGESTTIDVPIRQSLRACDQVEVGSSCQLLVKGEATVPVLGEWGRTRVL